jgi:hypothetical protein
MALSDELEALAKKHGALSYRNRADTQNPAFGFSVAGLESLLAEVRKRDEALIRQLVGALDDLAETGEDAWSEERPCVRIGKEAATAGRARLEAKK